MHGNALDACEGLKDASKLATQGRAHLLQRDSELQSFMAVLMLILSGCMPRKSFRASKGLKWRDPCSRIL